MSLAGHATNAPRADHAHESRLATRTHLRNAAMYHFAVQEEDVHLLQSHDFGWCLIFLILTCKAHSPHSLFSSFEEFLHEHLSAGVFHKVVAVQDPIEQGAIRFAAATGGDAALLAVWEQRRLEPDKDGRWWPWFAEGAP